MNGYKILNDKKLVQNYLVFISDKTYFKFLTRLTNG